MEPSQYFSIGVIAICVLHLLSTAWEGITAWWNEIVQRKNHQGGLAMKSTRNAAAALESQVQQRSDWYAYFHCADLVGPETPRKSTHLQKNITSAGRAQGPSRRPRARLTIS